MPFGLAPAPGIFQKRLDEALQRLSGVITIVDDILVVGNPCNNET